MYYLLRIVDFLKNILLCFQDEQINLFQNKIKAITEKLDISEQKLIEFATMPDIEEQLKDRMEVFKLIYCEDSTYQQAFSI